MGRDDLRTWVAELGLSLLVRATAESLDELIRGPLPVVLVSLTRNTVMEAGVGGDESIYGDEGWGYRDAGGVSGRGGGGGGEVRNGTAGNRGGRTLEDIVRTVAADYTDSVVRTRHSLRRRAARLSASSLIPFSPLPLRPSQRFAFYFDEDLPLLGEALGVELPAPGQPLFSWEAKGGLRFLFPHPVKCACTLASPNASFPGWLRRISTPARAFIRPGALSPRSVDDPASDRIVLDCLPCFPISNGLCCVVPFIPSTSPQPAPPSRFGPLPPLREE